MHHVVDNQGNKDIMEQASHDDPKHNLSGRRFNLSTYRRLALIQGL